MTDIPTIKVLISPSYDETQSLKELLIELTVSVSDVVELYEDDSRFKPLIALSDDIPNQRGLLNSGKAFITLPVSSKITRNIVEWDLDKAPEGTRAVWTFGEGPGPIEKVGPVSLLSDSVYVVGPIQSNPPAPVPGSISDNYGYYWFGELPSNIAVIKDIHHEFFLKVSSFFDDTPSPDNPYRSFVRSNQKTNAFGGTGFTRSHIFDYDSQISYAQDYDLIRRLSHEMIHNFLGPLPYFPSLDNPTINWLYEGIKNTLSIYLPFRNRFRTGDYFSSTLSTLCLQYYTSPLLNTPQPHLLTLASQNNQYAKELLASRAWAFVISCDFRARKLSELMRPIEDLAIKPLAKKRARGESYGIEDWIQLLKPLMGGELRERYERVKQEVLDFGLDRWALDDGVVRGLVKGSRAEEKGLREGDRVVECSGQWRYVEHFEAEMEVLVERDGDEGDNDIDVGKEELDDKGKEEKERKIKEKRGKKEVKITWWPRGREKVNSWVMAKVEEG